MEHDFTVSAKEAGERIDKWLCRKLPNRSRKQIKSLIDAGSVRVNSKRVMIAGWELVAEDRVEIRMPVKTTGSIERHKERERGRIHTHEAGGGYKKRREGSPRAEGAARLKVYYEDRDLIVVEKPAGMLSVSSPDRKGGESLQASIKAYLRRKYRQSKSSFLAPLHRLDVETSGLMVFALSKVGQKLLQQFENHSIGRAYDAIVTGRIERERGIIDKPLEKGRFERGQKARQSQSGFGRRAITEYRVKERYKNATFLEAIVRTGRTHQIRVHLASEGHPIIGDAIYSEGKFQGQLGFRRQALHAHSLSFKHPASGKKISCRSPLPHDMKELIDKLREQN